MTEAMTSFGVWIVVLLGATVVGCGDVKGPSESTKEAPVVGCPASQTMCGSVCTTLASDNANCGACGNFCGPTTRCVSSECTTVSRTFTPGTWTWKVPVTGTYQIVAVGGSGGLGDWGTGVPGGLAALATSRFELSAGTTLKILAGGAGSNGYSGSGGGGGGGSFVAVADGATTPLLVAGGGGGGGNLSGFPGVDASLTTSGTAGTGDTTPGAGGANGEGGGNGRGGGGGGGGHMGGGSGGGSFIAASGTQSHLAVATSPGDGSVTISFVPGG